MLSDIFNLQEEKNEKKAAEQNHRHSACGADACSHAACFGNCGKLTPPQEICAF